jgi:phage FluMu protein Com
MKKLLNFLHEKRDQGEYQMSDIVKIKCPKCRHVTEFDKKKVPTGVKFDYKCAKCGILHLIKLT